MIIKNYKYDYSSGIICYTIDLDGYEQAMEHTKTEYGSVQRNDIDDFLGTVEEYDFQEAEMIESKYLSNGDIPYDEEEVE